MLFSKIEALEDPMHMWGLGGDYLRVLLRILWGLCREAPKVGFMVSRLGFDRLWGLGLAVQSGDYGFCECI